MQDPDLDPDPHKPKKYDHRSRSTQTHMDPHN